MNKLKKAKAGRPSKLFKDSLSEALFILDVGCAITMNRTSKLAELGLTKAKARKIIGKRHRGLTGMLIGDALQSCHYPQINKTKAALRCIVEDGMPASFVARYFDINVRNLYRQLPIFRKKYANEVAAINLFMVSDAE
jgi:hypothetical protein